MNKVKFTIEIPADKYCGDCPCLGRNLISGHVSGGEDDEWVKMLENDEVEYPKVPDTRMLGWVEGGRT